ncbi:MAG: Fis family transcriptional regulator [Deltaproteobacteria bacterium]|nr:Fis family transcriptional regulator [Deltaproteobacteria bacterium]
MHSGFSIFTLALCVFSAAVGCGDDGGSTGRDTGTGGGRDSGGGGESGPLTGITAAHNTVRAATGGGVAPLTWDDGLAATAQAWADNLASRGCDPQHSMGSGYGENLAAFGGTTGTAQGVVDAWVSERDCYTYGTFMGTDQCVGCERSGGCGHYTQVVWANSRRLGCGMATCDGAAVWVCRYDPPGNVLTQEPY